MDELLHALAAHRRRIRLARAADAALRWGFYVSVAACVTLAVFKFAGAGLPLAAAAALAAVPLAMAAREFARAFSIRDCAIHLDRLLGLDERLSTALEVPGAMGRLLVADARVALTRTPLPARRLPREAGLLGGSLLLLAALAVIPSPGRTGATGDPAFEAMKAEEIATLESLAKVDVQFKRAAEELARNPEGALLILEDLRRKLAENLMSAEGASAAEARKLLEQVDASMAAISAELARLGRTVHAPSPAVARVKLERQKAAEAVPAAESGSPSSAGTAAFSDKTPWSPRYDPVIRRYFGRSP